MDNMSRYGIPGVWLAWLVLRNLRLVLYIPKWDSYLLYWQWYINVHTKYSSAPVSHDDFLDVLSSLSCFSSSLPSPKNRKFCHLSLSLSMLWSWVKTEYSICQVLHAPSTAYTKHCMYQVLHHPKIHCLLFQNTLSSLHSPCCTQHSAFP